MQVEAKRLTGTQKLQGFFTRAPLCPASLSQTIPWRGAFTSSKREMNMKTLHWKPILVAAIALLAVGGQAKAQSTDNDGCSNSTLKGDYAFTVSGTIWVTDPAGVLEEVQRGGVAMTHFDGTGGLSQVDYVVSGHNNLPTPPPPPTDPVTGFHTMETGNYTVYSDCTGTFTINGPGTVIVAKFALSNHGKAIHTIVTALTLPSGQVTALIHSEGHKLGKIQEELD
jgi:hypothetical protein